MGCVICGNPSDGSDICWLCAEQEHYRREQEQEQEQPCPPEFYEFLGIQMEVLT